MRKIGQSQTDVEHQIDTALRCLPSIGDRLLECKVITTPVASPIRRALDAIGLHVRSISGDDWFVKYYYSEASHSLDLRVVADASDKAGQLGVTPALVDANPEARVLAFDWLGEGWRWGQLDVLSMSNARDAQLALRRQIQNGPAFLRDRDVFAEIDALADRAKQARIPLPSDLDWLLGEIGAVAPTLDSACQSRLPAHGDGVSSNVMVHESGALQLIDFDVAANDDPAHDLASALVEICPLKEHVAAGVASWSGGPDPALFAKCMLYGIADDLRWGLWSLVMFSDSDLADVEFFKYAQWRLLRARSNLQDRDFEAWCRSF